MDVGKVTKHWNTFDAATVHLTIAIRAACMKVGDALEIAIDALKQIDVAAVTKAILKWIRAHPWETVGHCGSVGPVGMYARIPKSCWLHSNWSPCG
jgi:ElaB/YqjD/DUF883 family membrane-anchored ribosome-binding protein